MFKKQKRIFPPGTFIPTPLRILSIIHLCIAFSALLYVMGYPFMGQLFENKRQLLIYEQVTTDEDFFNSLPYDLQIEINDGFQELKARMRVPFSSKFTQSISILLFHLPPFHKAWLLFSILIPLLLLIKIDGAARAAWLLPVITAAFIFDHINHTHPQYQTKEEQLFPNEQWLVDRYLKQPLPSSVSEQHNLLLKGWKLYLIDQWGNSQSPHSQNIEEEQLKIAQFTFNAARLSALASDKPIPSYQRRKSHALLLAFFLWNTFFAWYVNRRKWRTFEISSIRTGSV
jgi:hypothetical protein